MNMREQQLLALEIKPLLPEWVVDFSVAINIDRSSAILNLHKDSDGDGKPEPGGRSQIDATDDMTVEHIAIALINALD